MNVYRTRLHRRPRLVGTIDAEPTSPGLINFELDLFLHPGGIKEWALALRDGDDPSQLPGWRAAPAEPEDEWRQAVAVAAESSVDHRRLTTAST